MAKTIGIANYVGVLERGLKLPTHPTMVAAAQTLDAPASLVRELRGRPHRGHRGAG